MPGTVTHYIFAHNVCQNLKYDFIDHESINFVNIGAQGPDIFFYNSILQADNVVNFGKDMHERYVLEAFSQMKDYAITYKDAYLYSYIIGLICHYVLDITIHPFINARAKTSFKHLCLETSLDYVMLQSQYSHTSPQRLKRKDYLLVNPHMPELISKMHSHTAENVYHTRCTAKDINTCLRNIYSSHIVLKDMYVLNKIVTKTTQIFRRPAHAYGITNQSKNYWDNEGGLSNASFFDLYEEAVDSATELIEEFMQRVRDQRPLSDAFNKSYANGQILREAVV